MKFNWGHGLVVVILLGITGFLSLVIITTRERIDMVTDEYYPKELKYQEQIQKTKNYNALSHKLIIDFSDSLHIKFPKVSDDAAQFKGVVHIYRPSDKRLDIEKEISLNDSLVMSIAKHYFKSGKYDIIIDWKVGDTAYLTKEPLYID